MDGLTITLVKFLGSSDRSLAGNAGRMNTFTRFTDTIEPECSTCTYKHFTFTNQLTGEGSRVAPPVDL